MLLASYIRLHHVFFVCAFVFTIWSIGCSGAETTTGTVGENGRAYFIAETQEVFSQRIMVGSYLHLSVQPVAVEDTSLILSSTFEVDDLNLAQVMRSDALAGEVDIIGPGQTYLSIRSESGELIDRIAIDAAYATRLDMLDPLFIGTQIDARMPQEVAVLNQRKQEVVVQATDRCDMPLVAINSYEVLSDVPQALTIEQSDSGFHLEGEQTGSYEILVRGRTGPEARLHVEAIIPQQVTDLDINLASANRPQVNLWGRLFTQSREVIGVTYEWSAEDNVSLSDRSGATVIGTLSEEESGSTDNGANVISAGQADISVGEESSADTAIVTAEWEGLRKEIDLLKLGYEDAQTERMPSDEEPAATSMPMGCGDDVNGECDPYAAFVLIVGSRLFRRNREKTKK